MEQADAKPLISVIVPVYNTKAYLSRCVESIRAQSYRNLEILLVDDGSTDGSGEVCDEYVSKDDRIVVYHKENGGSSSARNLGLAKANGEFIGFVDSDDYIEPDMYALLREGIRKYDASVAQVGRDEVEETGDRLPDICVPPVAAPGSAATSAIRCWQRQVRCTRTMWQCWSSRPSSCWI